MVCQPVITASTSGSTWGNCTSSAIVCSWVLPGSLNASELSAVVTVTSLGFKKLNFVLIDTKPLDTRVDAGPVTGTPQSSRRVRRKTLPRMGAKVLVMGGTGGSPVGARLKA